MMALPRPHARRLRRIATVCVIAALPLAVPAIASAAPEAEPNDDIFQANVVTGADAVTGTVATSGDQDVFQLWLRPQRQITIRAELTNPQGPGSTCSQSRIGYELTDSSDLAVLARDTVAYSSLSREHNVTTLGVQGDPSAPYLLKINRWYDSFAGCSYRITFSAIGGGPTDVIDTTPRPVLPVVQTREPDDLPSQAFGPLAPDTFYSGSIETNRDEDWLVANLRPGVRASAELSAVGDAADLIVWRSSDTENDDLAYATVLNNDAIGHTRSTELFTVPQDGRIYLTVRDRSQSTPKARWRVRITPASAFAIQPAPSLQPSGRLVLRGTAKADRLVGGRFNDILRGMAGNDRLYGRGGDDRLFGFAGNDLLVGDQGNDILAGNNGADRLRGGPGNDELSGGPGNDHLEDRQGRNIFKGGPGNDVIIARNGARETVFCGPGRDRVRADAKDRLVGCELRI